MPAAGVLTAYQPRYTPLLTEKERSPPTQPLELAEKIADLLSDRQAVDIVLMDIGKVSTFTDYFVIATANNPRQMTALVDSLDRDLRDDGVKPRRVEGAPGSGWVLIDFGDAIVHLFAPEERDYYNLESLWAKGVSVVHIQ
ncbi:MAG: ribosome silencing factor [Chloroflexi bacterium]|nr:ribosome silencing factor [Chloroflexota bacterium]